MKTYNLDDINKLLKTKYDSNSNELNTDTNIEDTTNTKKSNNKDSIKSLGYLDQNKDISSIEEFDKAKTRVLKYVIYKKRTEKEIRDKFYKEYDENLLEDIIQDLKENGYIDDYIYIQKYINEVKLLKCLSMKEINYKLQSKGIKRKDIEDYFSENYESLIEYEKMSAKKLAKKKSSTMEEQDIKSYLIKKGYKEESIGEAL